MKKAFLILSILLTTVILMGQIPDKNRKDYEVYKPSPALYLHGTNATINFNDDVSLRQSTNLLTLDGGNLSLGTNSFLLTGSIGTTSARVTKGWFTNISVSNAPTILGVSMAQIMTVSKTIGGVSVTGCDFNFVTAANQTAQPIDLGALIPANARILNVQTVTNTTFTGAISLAAITGTTTGGNDLITTAPIYTANAITATPNGGVFIGPPSATAVHLWLTATPGANWSLVTAGKVTVYVTYIAY
jgi:hypothetical protein